MEKSDVENVVEAATKGRENDDESDEEFHDAAIKSDEEFHDAADGSDGVHDLTRPSDWTPGKDKGDKLNDDIEGAKGDAHNDDIKQENSEDEKNSESDEKKDSTGCLISSPDYVDEERLEGWENTLTIEEKEQKRLEANQYKLEGNALYMEGKHLNALDKYTQGLRVCPLSFKQDRSILYANRGTMKKALGFNQHAIDNCTKALELNPGYLKALVRRAQLYEETDKLEEALKDFQAILELDGRHLEANNATRRLPGKIEERNEKLKAEMFTNLKKLGNLVLNPFGMSTDNFKMEQDPNTGGYNVQFQQNPK